MMARGLWTAAVTLLLAAALFVPLALLRPASENFDAGSATPPPEATFAAEATSPPELADVDPTCGSATVSHDAMAPTIASRAEGASAVLIATVESVRAARWNTDNGKSPEFDGSPPMDAYIYRPVALSLDTPVRGDNPGPTLEVKALGGSAGCYSFNFEDGPELKAGQQYAFFLGPSLEADGTQDAGGFTINTAWPISAGFVQTPLEGNVAIAAFLAAVEAAPAGPLGQ